VIVLAQDQAGPARTESVADGVLRCIGKPGEALRTGLEFGDYVLALEWVDQPEIAHRPGPLRVMRYTTSVLA
jgi:hypothetical protein